MLIIFELSEFEDCVIMNVLRKLSSNKKEHSISHVECCQMNWYHLNHC